MRSWALPDVPDLSSRGLGQVPRVYDSARGAVQPLRPDGRAGIYVCGITPYDATHMGHAATFVTFDLLLRALRDAGHEVHYVQNVTDIDDPLLERAARDHVDWAELAEMEIQLFRDDMEALRVVPPRDYFGVVERMDEIGDGVRQLVERGLAYEVDTPEASQPGTADIYLDLAATPRFPSMCGWSREEMLAVFGDRGGDPSRPGKKDALDPLLWRVARADEPSWSVVGLPDGRPGWHIECTCIAVDHLGAGFDVQGGGIDLVFPHHEMSAVQAEALYGPGSFARSYVHQEMVGLDGAKMSKSKGNLILVSRLREQGVDPMAIRLTLLAHHYRTPWDWTDDVLTQATDRLAAWRSGIGAVSSEQAQRLLADLRSHLADDLDTPAALAAADACLSASQTDGDGSGSALAADALDALLGIRC